MGTNSNIKVLKCNGCGKTKTTEYFSKCRARKSGYQSKCKECNKKDNEYFRKELKPQYWNYVDGYFSDKTKWEYVVDYLKADKPIKVYLIKTPPGYYVGVTSAHLHVRLNNHLSIIRRIKEGEPSAIKKKIPFYEALLDYEMDEIIEFFKGTVVLEERLKADKFRLEQRYIKKLKNEGYYLLNKQHNS